MIIYQLHEYTGEWEDFCDIIRGSYSSRKRAEEEKAKAEAQQIKLISQSKRCFHCPLKEAHIENCPTSNINSLLFKYPNYCSKAKLEVDEYGDVNCENYYFHWGESTFEIKEVKVEVEVAE